MVWPPFLFDFIWVIKSYVARTDIKDFQPKINGQD